MWSYLLSGLVLEEASTDSLHLVGKNARKHHMGIPVVEGYQGIQRADYKTAIKKTGWDGGKKTNAPHTL